MHVYLCACMNEHKGVCMCHEPCMERRTEVNSQELVFSLNHVGLSN